MSSPSGLPTPSETAGVSRILIVDDDPEFARIIGRLLSLRHFAVDTVGDLEAACTRVAEGQVDGVVLDHSLAGATSEESLRRLRAVDAALTIVVLSGQIDVPDAVKAIRLGAEDVQTKPPDLDLLQAALERGLQRTALLRSRRALVSQVVDPYGVFDDSPVMQRVLRQIEQCALRDLPVLLVGEAGTGKRALAEIMHQLSRRAEHPFFSIAVAGRLTDDLSMVLRTLQAVPQQRTVFLDDFRAPSMEQQRILLQLMESQGSGESPQLRFIVATTRDLAKDVAEGRLLGALYQRLSLLPVHIPALRERGAAAIEAIAERTRRRLRIELGQGPEGFSATALNLLCSLHWPENVPQLRDVVEEAFSRAMEHSTIDVPHVAGPLGLRGLYATESATTGEEWTLREAERRHIAAVLAMTGYNRAQAARLLGITRTTLYKKVAEFGLKDET